MEKQREQNFYYPIYIYTCPHINIAIVIFHISYAESEKKRANCEKNERF